VTFGQKYILFEVSGLRGIAAVMGLDNGCDEAQNPCLAKAAETWGARRVLL
jgi:hypothetical protein